MTDVPKTCPVCKLVNAPTATRCDCGWDFETRKIEKSFLEEKHFGAGKVAALGGGAVLLIIMVRFLLKALFAN